MTMKSGLVEHDVNIIASGINMGDNRHFELYFGADAVVLETSGIYPDVMFPVLTRAKEAGVPFFVLTALLWEEAGPKAERSDAITLKAHPDNQWGVYRGLERIVDRVKSNPGGNTYERIRDEAKRVLDHRRFFEQPELSWGAIFSQLGPAELSWRALQGHFGDQQELYGSLDVIAAQFYPTGGPCAELAKHFEALKLAPNLDKALEYAEAQFTVPELD